MTRRRAAPGRLGWAVALAALVLGCGGPVESVEPVVTEAPPTPPVTPAGDRVELVVFGAASLRDVLAAAKAVYEADHPEVTLSVAADSSAALRTQIEQGALADVFLSADITNAQQLADAGLTRGPPVEFASNALALVVPSANPARIEGPADLARPGVKIVAAGEDVPITAYASIVVASLAALPGYPSGFAAAYLANVVSHEANVRAVLTKVELGEADAGFVYVTDAVSSSDVRVIPLPADNNVTAGYAGVVPLDAVHPDEASRFLAWIAGPDGQAVLARFGFGPRT
ncbi:MAG TPA: molybdate ABC transporter substrate-binding protein [Candidatus Deferrimicrobiaceae bacterium]|nr:molybdate ABC transporter substrate-binding protein [Candidatus Deferrimicrobiaceae bacterium]